jgi:hypothetical protein
LHLDGRLIRSFLIRRARWHCRSWACGYDRYLGLVSVLSHTTLQHSNANPVTRKPLRYRPFLAPQSSSASKPSAPHPS